MGFSVLFVQLVPDVRGNPSAALPSSAAYIGGIPSGGKNPQFTSPAIQTVNVKIGETVRLPCDVLNLGKDCGCVQRGREFLVSR